MSTSRFVARPCQDERMKLTQTILALDAADLDAVSSFWAALLSGTGNTWPSP